MKRFTFFIFLGLLLGGTSLNAQKLNIGVNGTGALPLGEMAGGNNFGAGGGISLDYYFNDKFDLGIEAGYVGFNLSPDFLPISLTAALHQDINDWIDLYGELGTGAYIGNSSIIATKAYFGVSPRVGVAFELTSLLFLDVNINYHYVLSNADFTYNANWVGLNLGLLYTLGEF